MIIIKMPITYFKLSPYLANLPGVLKTYFVCLRTLVLGVVFQRE